MRVSSTTVTTSAALVLRQRIPELQAEAGQQPLGIFYSDTPASGAAAWTTARMFSCTCIHLQGLGMYFITSAVTSQPFGKDIGRQSGSAIRSPATAPIGRLVMVAFCPATHSGRGGAVTVMLTICRRGDGHLIIYQYIYDVYVHVS
jgi:hypothetical protein